MCFFLIYYSIVKDLQRKMEKDSWASTAIKIDPRFMYKALLKSEQFCC